MIKTAIACAILYGLWVVICLIAEHRKTRKIKIPPSRKTRVPPEDIMGRCLFSLSHSQPQATTKAETVKQAIKANTFAPEPDKRSDAKLSDDELDEVFSDAPEIEVEDVPLEWENETPIDYEQEAKEFDDDHYQGNYASGILYEDMDEAVEVVQKENPTPIEKQKAGSTFSQMEGSDLYNKLMMNAPLLEQHIKALLDNSQNTEPQMVIDDISDFDIRDFM